MTVSTSSIRKKWKRSSKFDVCFGVLFLLTLSLRYAALPNHPTNHVDGTQKHHHHQQQQGQGQGHHHSRQRRLKKEGHHHHRRRHQFDRAVVQQDFSMYSCDDMYQHAARGGGMNGTTRCAYARTCNDGDGILIPSVYCSSSTTAYPSRFLIACWCVPLLLLLSILFRILGSTAEEFFSPGLEMLSLELGLPERFAAVTLLALGNGAPDVASTVSAILNDRKLGYRMALGELTGAAMVASTLIVGAVTMASKEQVPCGMSLIRDVLMFIVTMVVVYMAFDDGSIVGTEIRVFVSMYLVYVLLVLSADLYHHHRRAIIRAKSPAHEVPQQSTNGGSHSHSNNSTIATEANEKTALVNGTPSSSRPKSPSYSVVEVVSNYCDNNTTNNNDDDDDDDDDDERNDGDMAHHHQQENGGWGRVEEDGTEPLMVFHPRQGGMVDLKLSERYVHDHHNGRDRDDGDVSLVASSTTTSSNNNNNRSSPRNWNEAWILAWPELKQYGVVLYNEMYRSDKYNTLDKFFMTCELPFMILRMLTIPVPCDGYYCRPLVSISITLCPYWIWYYMFDQFDVNIVLDNSPMIVFCIFFIPLLLGLTVLRHAPRGEVRPNLSMAVPITLIGFVVSATWLDLIADTLVNLLSFFGIICHIPSTIMGLTILAWGNSSQDLIANMTVARKGLSTMAMTASFAGPVFNILVGLGIGMSLLHKLETPGHAIEVELNNPLKLGFWFSIINGVLVIFCGVIVGKGILPKKYGYVAMALYFAYAMASLTT